MEVSTRNTHVHYSERAPMVCCSREYRLQCLQWRCQCIKVWLSPLLNSRATIRDLNCIGSFSNVMSVSIHFASTGVAPYFAIAFCSSTFSNTPRSRKYFNSSSRGRRPAVHDNSCGVRPQIALSYLLPSLRPNSISSRVLFRESINYCSAQRSLFLLGQPVTMLDSLHPSLCCQPFSLSQL